MTESAPQSAGGGAPNDSERRPASAFWRFAPLLLFVAIGAVFAYRLYAPASDTLESALLTRPAPDFELPALREGEPPLTGADLRRGEVSVVNLWASWCAPCRVEHPELMRLSQRDDVTVFGVAYRDKPDASRAMLTQLGDPFAKIGVDENGQAALKWGIEGVPETFVISGDGRVVYKHTGPIVNDDYVAKILPAIKAAQSLSE